MAKACETKTVLVIEDDAEVRNFASRVLELEGYRALQAEDGDNGLRLARESRVALILLDLRLPKRSGLAVLELMRREPQLSVIPVIVFTASASASQREKALKMGTSDYLIKPFGVARPRDCYPRPAVREVMLSCHQKMCRCW